MADKIILTLVPFIGGQRAFDEKNILDLDDWFTISSRKNSVDALREALNTLHPLRLPNGKQVQFLGRIISRPKDDPITYLYGNAFNNFCQPGESGLDLMAAIFFIRKFLPPETPVLLVWH